jgi:hypothetical protein
MNWFVFIIVVVKLCFISLAIANKISKPNAKLVFYKDKTEFIYIALMAVLLLYTFNPRTNITITSELKYLFFLMGIVILVTAEWREFFDHNI